MKYEDWFETNTPLFQEYMRIIAENQQHSKTVVRGRNLHHIIPRSFWKKKGLLVNNDPENLVSLTQADHFKVHWIIWKIAVTGYKSLAFAAVKQMSECILIGIGDNYDDVIKIADIIGKGRDKAVERSKVKRKKRKRGVDSLIKSLWANLPE